MSIQKCQIKNHVKFDSINRSRNLKKKKKGKKTNTETNRGDLKGIEIVSTSKSE